MLECLIVSDDALLDVARRGARPRLLAIALAPAAAELFSSSAEPEFTAADIEGTLGARVLCVFAALCMCIAVTPAVIVGRLPSCAAVGVAEAAKAGLSAAGSIAAWFVFTTVIFIPQEKVQGVPGSGAHIIDKFRAELDCYSGRKKE